MKYKIFILLIGTILLSGCSNRQSTETKNPVAETEKVSEAQLGEDDILALIQSELSKQNLGMSENEVMELIKSEEKEQKLPLTEDEVSKFVKEEIDCLRNDIKNYIQNQLDNAKSELSEEEKAELEKTILESVENMMQEKINSLDLSLTQVTNEYITEEYITEKTEINQTVNNEPINNIKELPVGGSFPMVFFEGTDKEFIINSISATIEPSDNKDNLYEPFTVKHYISAFGSENTKYEIIFQNSGLNYWIEIEPNGNFEGIIGKDIRMDASAIYIIDVRIIEDINNDDSMVSGNIAE